MNKTIKFLTTLLLMAVSVGAWAEEVTGTITFGTNNVKINASRVDAKDNLENSWIIVTTANSPSYTQQPDYSQVGSSKNPATKINFLLNLPEAVNITSMSAKFGGFSGTAGTITMKVGNTTVGTGSLNEANDVTVSSTTGATGESIEVEITNISKGVKCYYISYTYDDGQGSNLEQNDLALSGSTALSFDLYNNSNAQTISYTTSSTGAVTVSESEYVTTTVNNGIISVTPVKVTPSAQTITVSQAADETYAAGSVTFTVSIADSTPIPTYTVTLGDDNTTLTEENGNAGVILPTRDAIGSYTFAGWSETNVETETTTAPTIIPIGTYHPTANITLYPVYTRTEGGSAQNNTASVTIADYASANNWVSGSNSGPQYTEVILNSDVKATTTGTGNNGKYYSDWRFYQNGNGNVIISTTNGTLKSVKFTFSNSNSGTLNYNNSAVTSGTAVNVSGTSAEFTVGNSGTATNGQIRITAIEVIYTIGNSTTYYWSSPIAAAVERPVIDVPENFTFSTTATITCATEGASIKYSFDNENWSDYTESLTITETKTIYAKGVKGTDESEVVSKTTTKQQVTPTVTINATGITNTNVYDGTDAGTLAATVAYNDNAIADATVTWSGNNNNVATINAETGAVTLVAAGTVTFTATYAGNSDYAQATATYEMTVTNTDPNAPGTQNNPYTVAQAIAYIQTLGSSTSPSDVYVHGIISQVDSYNEKYHSITYWISDDGTTTNQMEVYSGKGLDGADFSSKDDLMEGDIVTVKGKVKKYNSTYEFDYNNELVSLERPVVTDPVITLAPSTVNVGAAEDEGTIAISYNNFGLLDVGDFVIQYCDAEGNEATNIPVWIVADVEQSQGGDFVVSYVVEANDGAARTAYFKVYAMDDNENPVYSNLVTITQAAYVAPVEGATFTLAHSVTPGKEYIIVSEENLGEAYAMGAQNNNNRAAVKVNVDNNNIEVTSSDVRVFVIEADGDNYTIYDAVEGGYLYAASNSSNHLKTQQTLDNNGRWSIAFEDGAATIEAQGTNSRNLMRFNSTSNLFSCYASGQQPVYLYEKVEATPEYVTVSISDAGMATLSSENALDFTNVTTIEAYYATLDNSGNVAYHRIYKVPAETGLLIRNAAGEAQGAVSADVPTLTETAESVEGNILVAALEAITGLQNESNGYKNYILNKHSQYGLGFYLANGKNLAANRAFMRIPVGNAREFIGINFDGDATGIESIRLNGIDDAIYDLQGRKVMNPAKGLYIVNGKKVVVK